MAGRWFRFYEEALNDPKVQALAPDLFKVWVNLLCVASRNDGLLPRGELAFALRLSEKAVTEALTSLRAAGLIDMDGDDPRPHNWDVRQFKSDTSNERVKRHRDKRRNVSGNDDVTLHETPPETETDSEQRESARAQAVRLPDGWTASAEDIAYAKAKGVPEDAIERDISKFRNHYQGNGQLRANWSAMWRKWIDGTCEKSGYKPALVAVTGTIPSVLIGRDDVRWSGCARRWQAEHGEAPKAIPMNRFPEGAKSFPADWPETKHAAVAAA